MDHWIDLTLGPIRWSVRADWRDLLIDDRGLRWSDWQKGGKVEVIKDARHRSVHRVTLPLTTHHSPFSIYIKHYPLSGLRGYVRQAFRPVKARSEAKTALLLAARGVPSVEPLAHGQTALGESWLVTLGLENVQPLNQFIEQTLPKLPCGDRQQVRLALTDGLGKLMAKLHEAGVRHPDLHAGNILVCRDQDRLGLFLIDLHGVRLGGPLDWPASRDNLVMLNRWFVQRSSRADRQRFWRIYCSARSQKRARCWAAGEAAGGYERDRALELEKATWASCLAFWRNRGRRCLGANRYFYRLRHHQHCAWAVRDFPKETLRTLLADPDAPFAGPGVKILKHSRSSTVAELSLEINGASRPVIFKRIMPTRRSDPWLHIVRPTPALRSWVNGHRLLDSGLPTPRPLAVLHRRRAGLTYECYLLAEKLPNAVELHRHVAVLGSGRGSHLRTLIDQAARLVRALHDRQLAHRDLKAANILVSDSRLWLIDLVGVERWRRLPRSRRIQNLARLHTSFQQHPLISRSDKLRFLRVYLQWGLKGRGDWKRWWREIAVATAVKLAKNARRGRPVS
jgi:tRNA A-37 threonylcarbamoyl transferase component Bud32